ncbi:MAG: hypothetical protein K6E73_12355 [Bacteroidales bacterium]|nr:hypothetical protein [Bacteroidales bacterium]
MAQNVFMVSMYFFVPIERVCEEIVSELSFGNKVYNEVFNNIKCELSIASLEEKVPFVLYYKNECNRQDKKNLYLIAYLLKYRYSELCEERYFLSFGTSIDKVFEKQFQNAPFDPKLILTQKDIVKLKWTFVATGKEGNTDFFGEELCLVIKDTNTTHVKWIEKIISKYKLSPKIKDLFYYSMTDVCGVNIDIKSSLSELNQKFSDAYYQNDGKDYLQELGSDSDKFAYGLMVADDYYENYTPNTILKFNAQSYFLKTTERMYISHMGTVNIKIRCPYENPVQKPICLLAHSFTDVFFSMEFCTVLYCKERLKSIKKKLDSNDSKTISIGQVELSKVENEDIFNLEESRQRMECLYSSMGVYDDITRLSRQSQPQAGLLNLINKETEKKENKWLTYISMSMVLVQILLAAWTLFTIKLSHYDLTLHTLILLLICSLLFIFLISVMFVSIGKELIWRKNINAITS